MSNFLRENHFRALEAFSAERARQRKVDIDTLIHAVLHKGVGLSQEIVRIRTQV